MQTVIGMLDIFLHQLATGFKKSGSVLTKFYGLGQTLIWVLSELVAKVVISIMVGGVDCPCILDQP